MAVASAALGGKLHILVNCAAGNFLAAAEQLSTKGFRTVLEIDTVGTFQVTTVALPYLRAAGGASVINISATLHYGFSWWQVCAAYLSEVIMRWAGGYLWLSTTELVTFSLPALFSRTPVLQRQPLTL